LLRGAARLHVRARDRAARRALRPPAATRTARRDDRHLPPARRAGARAVALRPRGQPAIPRAGDERAGAHPPVRVRRRRRRCAGPGARLRGRGARRHQHRVRRFRPRSRRPAGGGAADGLPPRARRNLRVAPFAPRFAGRGTFCSAGEPGVRGEVLGMPITRRHLLVGSLALALAAPVAARGAGFDLTHRVDPTTLAQHDTEPVVLTGASFPAWAAPAEVTAEAPGTGGAFCQGGQASACTHNQYETPTVDSSTATNQVKDGVAVGRLLGYKWQLKGNGDGHFVQIPFQVDEVATD